MAFAQLNRNEQYGIGRVDTTPSFHLLMKRNKKEDLAQLVLEQRATIRELRDQLASQDKGALHNNG